MSMEWWYRRAREERHGPVTDAELRGLIERGELQPQHEIWRQGMVDWMRIEEVVELRAPAPAASDAAALTTAATAQPGAAGAQVVLPPGLTGWMTFVGIMTLISGVLGILSCFGLPTGVLMVIAGISLLGAKSALEPLSTVDHRILPFLNKLKLFMVMQGIVFILSLIIGAPLLIFYFSVIMAALASADF